MQSRRGEPIDSEERGQESHARSSSAVEYVALFLVYALVAAWWLWPLPATWRDHAVHIGLETDLIQADFDLMTWVLAWDVHALTTRPSELFDANIFFPARNTLAFSEHLIGYLPLFAPILLVTGNPVLASNLTLFLTFPLCGVAMYAFARRFLSRPAAFLAGSLFAFCGLRYHTLWHFYLLGVFWMPLALLFIERWLERAQTRDAVLLGIVVLFQLLSSYYLAYAMIGFLAAYVPVALWRWRERLDARRLVGLAVACVAAALPTALLSLPYLELRDQGLIRSYADPGPPWNAMLSSGVTRWRVKEYLYMRGVGPLGYALTLVALLPPWRRYGAARAIGITAVVAGVVLASGPRPELFGVELWSPYSLLLDYLPGFDAIRLPRRFLVVSQLGFALLAAVGIARVLAWLGERFSWPLAAAVALVALWTSGPLPPLRALARPTAETMPPAIRWLAEHGNGRALLEVPLGSSGQAGDRMMHSTHHWLPMIDGYSAYPPPTKALFARLAQDLPAPDAVQRIVDLVDVGWIAVHLDGVSPESREAWTSATIPGLDRMGEWDGIAVFRVTLEPKRDLRARLFARDSTPGGVRLAPLGDACSGRIEATLDAPPSSVAPGTPVPMTITLTNQSDSPWPGLAVHAEELVQLRAATTKEGKEVGTPQVLRLNDDVPAGTTWQDEVSITMPPEPGSYTLELAAVQGGRPLEPCGLATFRLPLPLVEKSDPARGSEGASPPP